MPPCLPLSYQIYEAKLTKSLEVPWSMLHSILYIYVYYIYICIYYIIYIYITVYIYIVLYSMVHLGKWPTVTLQPRLVCVISKRREWPSSWNMWSLAWNWCHVQPIPWEFQIPSGELTFCHGKSPFLMGKSTISMAISNCYVSSPKGSWQYQFRGWWGKCHNVGEFLKAEREREQSPTGYYTNSFKRRSRILDRNHSHFEQRTFTHPVHIRTWQYILPLWVEPQEQPGPICCNVSPKKKTFQVRIGLVEICWHMLKYVEMVHVSRS